MARARGQASVVSRLLRKAAALEKMAAKENGVRCVTLSEEQLRRKLSGETTNSPFFRGWAWWSSAQPEDQGWFKGHYYNPDPDKYTMLSCSFYFGLGVVDSSISPAEAIAMRDTSWPSFSSADFELDSAADGEVLLRFETPYVQVGRYYATTLLWNVMPILNGEPAGTVFDTAGWWVDLYAPVSVPNVIDDGIAQAEQTLEAVGLQGSFTGPGGPAARVWKQAPPAGTPVAPGTVVSCTTSLFLHP